MLTEAVPHDLQEENSGVFYLLTTLIEVENGTLGGNNVKM